MTRTSSAHPRCRRLGRSPTRLLAWLMMPLGLCAAAPPATLAHGPFEIAMPLRRIGAGGFPNTTMNPFKTVEISEFELRHRGQPVETPVDGRRWWRALRLPDAVRPAVLLVTTRVHLASDRDGRLELLRIDSPEGDMPAVQWLDARDGQPAAEFRYGLARLELERDTELRGGQLLRVARQVLDLRTLTVHPITPWIASGSGHPLAGLNASTSSVVAVSPSKRRLVLPTRSRIDRGDEIDALMLVDLDGGPTEAVVLGRTQVPETWPARVDAAWIAARFAWQSGPDGRERLVAREARP